MTKQPEALRLAELLENSLKATFNTDEAAAELRRLHEVNHELLAALKDADTLITQLMPGIKHIVLQDYGFLNTTLLNNRAAIDKAEGEM